MRILQGLFTFIRLLLTPLSEISRLFQNDASTDSLILHCVALSPADTLCKRTLVRVPGVGFTVGKLAGRWSHRADAQMEKKSTRNRTRGQHDCNEGHEFLTRCTITVTGLSITSRFSILLQDISASWQLRPQISRSIAFKLSQPNWLLVLAVV